MQVNKALHTCTSRYAYAAMWRQSHWIYTESLSSVGGTPLSNASLPHGPTSDHVAPCVTFRLVVAPLRGPGQAVGGGCRSGWGRLLTVTNAIEAGTRRQGDSGWA